jgi:hypothetical protein
MIANGSSSVQGNTVFFQFTLQWEDAKIECYINDFPISPQNSSGYHSVPVNLLLIGKSNKVTIGIAPTSSKAIVNGELIKVDPANKSRTSLLTFNLDNITEAQEKVYTFDSDGLDFSHVISNTQVLTEKQVQVYAEKLYQHWYKKNTEKLLDAMKIKTRDYAIGYGVQKGVMRDQLISLFENNIYHQSIPAEANFELLPFANGRIWEIRVKPEKSFFFSKNAEGENRMNVFVALIGDEVQLIR